MATLHQHPAAMPPMPAVTRILAQFDRERLAGFIEVAIGLLDVMEGDPDVEANNDEVDGSSAEDDFWPHSNWKDAAGCPVSDPEEDDDMDCCMAGDDLARGGPIVLDNHWWQSVARGEQPGDADEHEPWQASNETQDFREREQ